MKFLVLVFFCISIYSNEIVKVEIGKVYKYENEISENEVKKIQTQFQNIVNTTLEKNSNGFLNFISEEKGVFLDLKGLWEFSQIKEEVNKEDSYFEIFFFNSEKLKNYTKNPDSKTVSEILQLSEGLIIDIFFDSKLACEINIRFKKNPKYEKDLNNPYFIKNSGKWYLYRFF